ncbi:MAG: hypothetical protein IJB31_03260 [Akkermansia sp.]|nr:hypothetical protein [Akkermansia sp.]
MKNITRYTYEKTSFQGWRLCLSRRKRLYVKYFADRVFGSEEASLAEAQKVRQLILDDLAASPSCEVEDIEKIFAKYR